MLLKTKLAFEIWTGIVLLIVVIGGVAGFTLISGNDLTPLLTKTQVNIPQASTQPLFTDSEILNLSNNVTDLLSGGTP